jgi:CDP-diacylglycerol--serine O-phosphatidyltransferase
MTGAGDIIPHVPAVQSQHFFFMRFFRPRPTFTELPAIGLQAQDIHILHSASAYKQVLLQQIAAAKRRIVLCSLYLQHDEAGQEILDALYSAKKRTPQLEILIFVDWHRGQRGLIGEQKLPGRVAGNAAWYQEESAKHGGSIPIYGVPVQTRELFGVLHLKGYVIDDTVIYSGASINNVYLQQFEKYRHDRYWLVANASLADSMHAWMRDQFLNSSAVHRLDQKHIPATRTLRSDIRAFREKMKKASYQLPSLPSVSAQNSLAVTNIVGLGNNNRLNRYVCQLLASAQKQLTICTPYFNFPLAITREVNRAIKRGVQVQIIVGDKLANDFFIPSEQPFKAISCLPYLYEMNLRRFAKKHQHDIASGALNIQLWQDGDNTYHLKGIWVDDIYTLVTGNNLNPRAFRLDLENALLFTDPKGELAAPREKELQQILQHTQRVDDYQDLQKLSDYPPKVRQFLSRLSRVRLDRLAYRVL